MLQPSAVRQLADPIHTPPAAFCLTQEPIRLALFASSYKGFFLLQEFLHGDLSDAITLVGVATDDPEKRICNASRRFWSYPHTATEKHLVRQIAEQHSIPVHTDRINTTSFLRIFEEEWRPDLLLVSAFGQRILRRLFAFPRLAAWNLHPAGEGWPSFWGGRPYEEMLSKQRDRFFIVLHELDEEYDHGRFVARSKPIFIPPEASVKDLHKLSAVPSAAFAAEQVAALLAARGIAIPAGKEVNPT